MLGAIIGDVAGSTYEILEVQEQKNNKKHRSYVDRIKILDKSVPLFNKNSTCTDDSILTCAIYDAIKNGNCDYETYLKKYGLRELALGTDHYNRGRFGKGFVKWLQGDYQGESYGNGAAMRVSPVGFMFDKINDVKVNSRLATIPSHNNIEAILGAEAIAVSVYMLKCGCRKEEVISFVKNNYYDLDYNLEDLRRNYSFSSRTNNSVPQAIFVFEKSDDFEDAIRKALSIGGDSDTIASIVGALSEAYYGVPEYLKKEVKPYLRNYMYDLLKEKYYCDIINEEKDKSLCLKR